MATNVYNNNVKTLGVGVGKQEVPLTRQVNHHELSIVLTADVSIAGGATSGAVVANGLIDAIRTLSVHRDGVDLVQEMSGRDLLALAYRMAPEAITVEDLADGAVQANTIISAILPITISPKFIADPYEIFWPAERVSQIFSAYLGMQETLAALATALVTGGDRTVTVNSFTAQLIESYTVAPKLPRFIPVFTVGNTETLNAADTAHAYRYRSRNRIMAQIFQYREAAGTVADKINFYTVRAGLAQWQRNIPFAWAKAQERRFFGGIPASDPGTLFFLWTDNGRLGTVLEPQYMGSDPRIEFDVDAPATTAQLRVLNIELLTKPGVTLVEA